MLKRPDDFINRILKYCRVGATFLSSVDSVTPVSLSDNQCSFYFPRSCWEDNVGLTTRCTLALVNDGPGKNNQPEHALDSNNNPMCLVTQSCLTLCRLVRTL